MKKSEVIWIIDDDPGILEAVMMILEEENYRTKTIRDETILEEELKKEHVPQLILLDILLSGVDGRDIARKIKNNEKTKNVPIIMMSADTHIEQKAKESEADDFIRKPFDITDLIEKIERYTKK